tara:strand:- start:110 stop:883 length:774 start_codon:yes stop_codon:yes gene_type:complete
MNKKLSRRNLFKASAGLAGTLLGGKALAQVCSSTTARQALGPFFPNEGTPEIPVKEDNSPGLPIHLANDNDLTFVRGIGGHAQGQTVIIKGTVTDEDCHPLSNARIVIWQASHTGKYNHLRDGTDTRFQHPETGQWIERELDPSFQFWGQSTSDANGEYAFKTIVPGFYPADLRNRWYRPPHIHFMISAMGFPQLVTQMYFKGEDINNNDFIQELNQKDYLLQDSSLSEEQRNNLVVEFTPNPEGTLEGTFNITMKR